MDLLGVVRSCLRRWYVFFPILILTGYLAAGQYQAAAPQFAAATSVVVAPSQELVIARGQQSAGGEPVTTPFNGGSGQSTLAGLLATALNSRTINAQLFPEGGVALTATRDVDEDGTLVVMEVVTDDGATASAAVAKLQADANTVLVQLQTTAGAPAGQLYAAVPGGVIDPPVMDFPDRIRTVVALALAGTLAAVVLSVVAQALGRDRRSKEQKAVKVPKAQKGARGLKESTPRKPSRAVRESRSSAHGEQAPGGSRAGSRSGDAAEDPFAQLLDVRDEPTRSRRS